MCQTTLCTGCPWLSLDHTFKSVSNIGLVRPADKQWVKQYSGLFCVLNADGEVLCWKMTKTLSFDHMEDVLIALKNRLLRQEKQLEEFFIDNCCSFRRKLQSVFGPQLAVYLDIFHAVQRISTKIPKRHLYRHECLKSLTLVFRDPCDQGSVRTKITPPPDVLRRQMCKFQEMWEDMEYNGKKILPPVAVKEIHCLLVHIDRGCLSGIHPGRGTNRNERLHKDINSHMKNSRYGVELAYGLITAALFKHNENIKAKKENRCVAPIIAFKSSNNENSESFGLCTKSTVSANQLLPVKSHDLKAEMDSLKYHELLEVLNSMDIGTFEVDTSQAVDVTLDEAFTMLNASNIGIFCVRHTKQIYYYCCFPECKCLFHVISIHGSETKCGCSC